jgi:uncharacterized LabA/DUF88 family protein
LEPMRTRLRRSGARTKDAILGVVPTLYSPLGECQPLALGARMGKAIAYVDGLNLYYGLSKTHMRRFLWLNIPAVARDVLESLGMADILTNTKYFTAPMLNDPDRAKRQALYLDALSTDPTVRIFPGNMTPYTLRCDHCGEPNLKYHEKKTDTGMTAEIVRDALRDEFDLAILVTRDTDFVPAIRMVKAECPEKTLILARPPGQGKWAELKDECHRTVRLRASRLERCQFPDEVVTKSGVILRRPAEFRDDPPKTTKTPIA